MSRVWVGPVYRSYGRVVRIVEVGIARGGGGDIRLEMFADDGVRRLRALHTALGAALDELDAGAESVSVEVAHRVGEVG